MLTNISNLILSTTSTPSATEIAAQFSPKSLKPSYESLASENSGRSDGGTMHISWVKTCLPKLEIELVPGTYADINSIFSQVQGKKYYITYWDIINNAERTLHVYTSNSSADVYSGIIMNGLIQGAAFNAIAIGDDCN